MRPMPTVTATACRSTLVNVATVPASVQHFVMLRSWPNTSLTRTSRMRGFAAAAVRRLAPFVRPHVGSIRYGDVE